MDARSAYRVLAGLDAIDIDNLKSGRFTKDAVHLAAKRTMSYGGCPIHDFGRPGRLAPTLAMRLAEELNDMLCAAQTLADIQAAIGEL